jgi:hypothetical protein
MAMGRTMSRGYPELLEEHFDWARQAVDGLPTVNKSLREAFAGALALRP